MESQVHGALVEILGVGALILGPSGIGKSETALELVRRGNRLVADDIVRIRRTKDGLVGSAPPLIRHHIEIRGFGSFQVKVREAREGRNPKTGEPVPDGEPGVIEVRGPNVFQGYWQMPEKTAEELRPDGWFITGDIAVRSADGYISIVGRDKDMIISGGYNVYPKEIELLIDAVEGVTESAVIGVPHPDFGEAVTAIVVCDPGAGDLDEKRIVEGLRHALANFKLPKRVHFVKELPRNTMGKVQKNLLRERYGSVP